MARETKTARNGTVSVKLPVPGVIVENVSLGLAMCADGACLQVALELGGPLMPVYVSSVKQDAPISEATVAELLPNGPYVRR
ncbi:MAG: hypothetical protein ACE367_03165 [Acidimicrobiales bacterium]